MCPITLSWKSLWAGLFSVMISVHALPSSAWRAGSLWAGIRFFTSVCVLCHGQWHMMTWPCDQPSWIFSERLMLWPLVLNDCDFVQMCSWSCLNPYLLTFHLILFTDLSVLIPISQILLPSPHSSQPSASFHITHLTTEPRVVGALWPPWSGLSHCEDLLTQLLPLPWGRRSGDLG